MKRNVLITVSGLLFIGSGEREEDYIDVITPGKYYWRDDRHYLLYEEQVDEMGSMIRNRITMAPGQVTMRKTGVVRTEMVFIPKEETGTYYLTPFGQMEMKIYTNRIILTEMEDRLETEVRYKLDLGVGYTDCFVKIIVEPQKGEL